MIDPSKIDNFLAELEIDLLKRYNNYVNEFKGAYCKIYKKPASLLDYESFHINFSNLKEAIYQLKMDINIILMRRGDLIDDMRMSEGKIAGVVTFRLAKSHIIHIHKKCCVCKEKCYSHTNNLIAILIGLDYIHKKNTELPVNLQSELLYTIKQRHVNQETLGLVFDTIKELP